jgi:hypothetical protein
MRAAEAVFHGYPFSRVNNLCTILALALQFVHTFL